ncbi:CpsD/CapB family tyrosine-protein kinase [Thiohalobacter sp. IOR34]|uniref:CpsD/CapB family tyrosine-protein kinase n=1 Tax=Thiohalobacter sp. IOR34 TaxID=3057176 RepID=UPI0025AEEF3B|nr:CpsD/CapB family tyrosine-protein kinase [Thiohalobacter sp. IOR34]WJW76298.1 CpsD/CapB family tyrosine-protein kinase [Thiohalobacter sp. IOR34]
MPPEMTNIPIALPEHAREPLLRAVAQIRRDTKRDRLCVGICGCHHAVGSSTITINMAHQAATNWQESVLLIEGNKRSPSFSSYFKLDADTGFSEYLSGSCDIDEIIHTPSDASFKIITSGTDKRPLAIRNLPGLMASINKKAEMSFIDLPPVLPYTEAAELASCLDGVILVIRSEQDKWEVAKAAAQLLEKSGARLLGTILNRKQYYIPSWLYPLL